MAEYIDREKLIPDRCYYEPYGYEAISCDQIFHEDIADVIEREKINKAIEEIKAEIKENAEMQSDGEWYLNEKWIMEIIDKHISRNTRNCKSCLHSKDGECAFTEECHLCMYDNQHISN